MDAQDEMIIKKKRTKRIRPASPLSLTMATSSCNTGEGVGSGAIDISRATASSSSSGGLVRGTREEEEEEDMANCLILLAQGRNQKVTEETTLDSYQCKTCNRGFPSFQALGGHRASHRKPKPSKEDHKQPIGSTKDQEIGDLNGETTTLSLQISSSRPPVSNPSTNNKRVHECSICGAEFNSGQALGGHMRRHRPIPMVNTSNKQEECSQELSKKPRVILSLDLNLPAPPEDDHPPLESKFPFTGKEKVIVFSASPLVNCHY